MSSQRPSQTQIALSEALSPVVPIVLPLELSPTVAVVFLLSVLIRCRLP